jgi:hypothetical protein
MRDARSAISFPRAGISRPDRLEHSARIALEHSARIALEHSARIAWSDTVQE